MQNINKDYFLLEKLKKGDSKAYSFLMDSYYKRLCGYANSLTNDIDTFLFFRSTAALY